MDKEILEELRRIRKVLESLYSLVRVKSLNPVELELEWEEMKKKIKEKETLLRNAHGGASE